MLENESMEVELKELRRKTLYLEQENKQLYAELEQTKAQMSQYKTVLESQQSALKDKDELLEQFKEVNESLKSDLKALRELKNTSSILNKSTVPAFAGGTANPWTDGAVNKGNEPEQYRKLFVGGLAYSTVAETLKEHFSQFGEVERAAIMKDHKQESRGFGFVLYKTAAMIDDAQANRPHVIDGRTVDTKRALPKEDVASREHSVRTNKLFVGGMSQEIEESHIQDYFSQFGQVESVEQLVYKDTGKKRGFAFVYLSDFDTVDKLVLIKHHVINGCRCEVKKAVPREQMHNKGPSNDHHEGGGGPPAPSYGGGYHDNNRSGFNQRPDYPQQQHSRHHDNHPMMDPMGMPPMNPNQAQAWAAYYSSLAQAAQAAAGVSNCDGNSGGPMRSSRQGRHPGPYGESGFSQGGGSQNSSYGNMPNDDY